ncbi:MAG: hypothetical protein LC649_02295 [Bacteroidales bacterium]|nr:hypothetical protein [Bacteroidales bacterium]
MDKSPKIEITELFMAKAGEKGWDRCFYGTIRRATDALGNPVVYGKIKVNDGYIIASASTQDELGKKLDEMVLLILDHNIQSMAGNAEIIAGTPFFRS